MMSSGESRVNQAIDITNVLTLGEIDRVYPDIQVIPIMNGSSPLMMDIMDQSQVSKRNVYSSMAASAIRTRMMDDGPSGWKQIASNARPVAKAEAMAQTGPRRVAR